MGSATPLDPSLPVGERIKFYRKRAGKTRAVLAGHVGKSEGWVKAIETGRLLPPRLPMLVKLAEFLDVPDLSALTGSVSLPTSLFSASEHPALSVVRRAVDTAPLGDPEGRVPSVDHVAAALAAGWRTRDARGDHRTALGELLPSLISHASLAASHPDCPDQRRALVLYASALNLVQMYAAYQGDGNLVWRVSERSLAAARASGDEAAIGQAAWFLVQAFRESGQWESAQVMTEEALRVLSPVRSDSPTVAAAWAAMAFHAAITHARAGEAGDAWHWFDRAEAVAATLPSDHWSSPTSASAQVVPIHAVTVAVELRQAGTALRWADRIAPSDIPARPRRARHLIEVARAHAMRNQSGHVVELLRDATEAAPETPRWNRETHDLVRGLQSGPESLRHDAAQLAEAVGLPA
ncbi:helix-turn-helix domain-containing protein [Streptomyces sp. NPDC056716]|uniref:helix-turn-helix domain-containing protein n=1 Tax=unclassified Streptomyces TaxID=2593676 RepID=UPI0036BAB037